MARQTVLILGNYRPALPMARSLADAGWRVAVSADEGNGAARHSRFVSETWENAEAWAAGGAALWQALARHLEARPDIDTVFPIHQRYVQDFFANRHRLPGDRLYVMPNREAVEVSLDKGRSFAAAEDAGFATARNREVADDAGLAAAAEEIGYPLIVKPVDSVIPVAGRKALILHRAGDLTDWLPRWPRGNEALIVQSYVDGPRINLYFAAERGRAVRYLAAEILRTDRPDGTGLATLGRTIRPDPALLQKADALIGRLGYHGIGCLQVLRDDRTGAPSFLEINPRIGGNHAITVRCGLGLETLAIALARGEATGETLRTAPAGVRYVWTTGALRGAAQSWKAGELGTAGALGAAARSVAEGLTGGGHVTFHPRDPMPALALTLGRIPRVGPLFFPSGPRRRPLTVRLFG